MNSFVEIPAASHYWLRNSRVPLSLLSQRSSSLLLSQQPPRSLSDEALAAVDLEMKNGTVATLQPTGLGTRNSVPSVNLQSGLIWPCFVDIHTHLDKGHIWPRSPNPNGTFASALSAVAGDSNRRWSYEDVYRRMEFGLKCSYAHGTRAVRTHLDASGAQGEISFEAFRALRAVWKDRLLLQAVCLVTLDYFMGEKGEKLADLVAGSGGALGGVAFMNPDIVQQIDRVFELATERGLDLDFHTGESLNPDDVALQYVAEAAIRHKFEGKVTCGHCCSLSVQSDQNLQKTVKAVKAAGISMVSLPMCNLYLQDRQARRTPRYRGVTILHELRAAGIEVALASDNCRDPFFAYGDHDGLEVFTQSTRIGHLDHPVGAWPQAVTKVPARMMGLEGVGEIGEGMAADFVIFKARSFNELMARGQGDRAVVRAGKQIDTTLPDYAELDDLMM